MINKKAQRVSAHTLVGIILLLIIFYIIFLPPSEREELLEGNKSSGGSSKDGKNETLLKEFPGTLSYLSKKSIDKRIPNVFLIETTNSKELARSNAFYVRNGVFDKKTQTVEFEIEDLKNTANVKLSFAAKKYKGVLMIKLNDRLIYENEIETVNIEPIELKNSYLSENNVLEFSVSGVGMKFWTTNEYNLDSIKIIGDITDVSRQKSENTFILTNEEYQNIEESTLKFVPYCSSEKNVGVLDVTINNRKVYSAVPVCDDLVKQEFSTAVLDAGENNVVFSSSRGSYSIEQVEFNINMKEAKSLLYYFEINESVYEDISDGKKDCIVYLKFVDDDTEKKFELNVNGHLRYVEEDVKEYSKNINSWIEEGNNYVEIRPKTTLDIVELRVELEKK